MPRVSPIVVRAYVVGFGDCIAVRVPDGDAVRHVLIDFGRAPGKGGGTSMFRAVARDVEEFCGGHLDLLVMTHEHLDHMEGFHHQREVFDRLRIDHVWMSLPSQPGYYDDYPDAQPQRRLRDLAGVMLRTRNLFVDPGMRSLLENNLSNVERIDYLRQLASKGTKVQYLARGSTPRPSPFTTAKVAILAPEKDVSVYYPTGKVRSLAAAAGLDVGAPGDDWWSFPGAAQVQAPANVSASDWTALRGAIQGGSVVSARFIDRAQNNTSLCFVLTVGRKRLLFPGDAELESWEMMAAKNAAALAPVDFIKVSHHGSHNGTPMELLDRLLPKSRKAQAVALVSTKRDVYGTEHPVPDATVLAELANRCREVHSTEGARGLCVEVEV